MTPRAPDMLTLSAQPLQARAALSLLGIAPDATLEQATRRYRQAVRDAHPDVHAGSPAATSSTARINAAWGLVRPLAEALEARRRAQPPRLSQVGIARVISADEVRLDEPKIIPTPVT